ncbi:hypothetical protein [Streptomyces albicerus]|uniref:hypothetical protein n=1 Tax=Streptomyces albicerus TaxID=2569859 RepID=UPI00124B9F94|nr:hypothetical protein [Streptomyces albicerus]
MASTDGTAAIAGRTSLRDVMARLRGDRPVFHSEADLQHGFARVLWELAPALMLTNEPSLWTPPRHANQRTRDHDFRIHQGRELGGTLLWAEGAYEPNTCSLRGTYRVDWQPYSEQEGPGGEFRYLAVSVGPLPAGAPDASTHL